MEAKMVCVRGQNNKCVFNSFYRGSTVTTQSEILIQPSPVEYRAHLKNKEMENKHCFLIDKYTSNDKVIATVLLTSTLQHL